MVSLGTRFGLLATLYETFGEQRLVIEQHVKALFSTHEAAAAARSTTMTEATEKRWDKDQVIAASTLRKLASALIVAEAKLAQFPGTSLERAAIESALAALRSGVQRVTRGQD